MQCAVKSLTFKYGFYLGLLYTRAGKEKSLYALCKSVVKFNMHPRTPSLPEVWDSMYRRQLYTTSYFGSFFFLLGGYLVRVTPGWSI
ncbi:hypothetical protein P167DRAFT_325294 [Morchella conica CCBAS932]|uniref:Uncharacterized protein n=1 Tax=Morchella conica CCBAS932 TaxID=1392247 RepID=A0A3N4KIH3_9PEZI|nr:hypothetical protein P167DRAFT_325294 [Morchella conica CCBAS932]